MTGGNVGKYAEGEAQQLEECVRVHWTICSLSLANGSCQCKVKSLL
jgi:hypothetical protein